ncbi:MAG TPA: hypothetical protein VFK69_12485, partial [Candidatus Eisenbacteria bacterium]|nr:hypothetical protein [Candidatus Eisenbacteria bacterium]
DGGAARTCALWRFESLPRGFSAAGPAIVAQDGATLWVPAGWRMRMHPTGTLIVRPRSAR